MRTADALTSIAVAVVVGLGVAACSSSSLPSKATTSAAGNPSAAGAPSAYVMVSPSTVKATPVSTPAGADPATTTAAAGTGSTLRYQKLVEPFSTPGTCNSNGSTMEMTACILQQVVDVDTTVNSLQLRRFETASPAKQPGLLAEDKQWLTGRGKTCAAAASSGGSIDQINAAECLLKASEKRVKVLNTAG